MNRCSVGSAIVARTAGSTLPSSPTTGLPVRDLRRRTPVDVVVDRLGTLLEVGPSAGW